MTIPFYTHSELAHGEFIAYGNILWQVGGVYKGKSFSKVKCVRPQPYLSFSALPDLGTQKTDSEGVQTGHYFIIIMQPVDCEV